MSAAEDVRKSDVEGSVGGGGPKGAAELTGGFLNYTFVVLNLLLSWLGWFLALCAIIALQHQINKSQDINTDANNFYVEQGQTSPDTFHSYAVNSAYPALPPGRLLRFEWFVLILTVVTLAVVGLALIGRILRQTRSMLVGYMAVNLVLTIIVTDRVYNLSHFAGHGKYYHSARALFTGWIFLDIGFFGLIYLLGLEF